MVLYSVSKGISLDDIRKEKKFVEWDSKFEMGIEKIDSQHKKLVELCDGLYKKIMETRADSSSDWHESMKGALKECADYVLVHFRDEETLMKAAGFTALAEHKRSHEMFTKKVVETVKSFSELSITDAIQFVRFLHEWIFTHIAHEDKLFAKPCRDYIFERESLGEPFSF